jgi:hypothetical protein
MLLEQWNNTIQWVEQATKEVGDKKCFQNSGVDIHLDGDV